MVTRFINKIASWGFLGAFLLIPVGVIGADLNPMTLRDFKAGLYTDSDSSIIPDGAAQDLQNVDVDDGSIRKRNGTRLVNATAIGTDQPVRFLHEYVDPTNSFWLLAVSSNTLYGSTNGGATFSVLTSAHGITATSRFQASNAFGKAYLVDGSTNAITFDGTSVALNTAAPIGGVTAFYAGRLWIANGSTIYGSRVSDATDWTDSGVDDADAFSAVVRNNDGYTVTAMKPFGQDLFIFKAKSIDRLSVDSDGLNFSLYPVTSHTGTTHPDSVATMDNAIVWLGQDGYYGYDGSTLKRISENITETVEGISQLDALTRSYSETDMTAGTDDNTTAERVSGQVMLSAATQTDTSAADFGAGTLTQVTTATVSGDLYPTRYAVEFSNPSFETGFGAFTKEGASGNWIVTSSRFEGVAASGSWSLVLNFDTPGASCSDSFQNNIDYQIRNSASGVLASGTLAAAPRSTWETRTISLAAYAGQAIYVAVGDTTRSSADAWLVTPLFVASGNSYSFQASYSISSGYCYSDLDLVSGLSASSYNGGVFVSRVFDSSVTMATWKATTPVYTLNGGAITFETRSSSNSVNWGAYSTWIPGSAPASADNRYLQYKLSFTTSTASTILSPFVSAVSLSAIPTSGRYISPAITLTGATSWLPFTAGGFADGGGLTYELYTDTNTAITPGVASTFISSQTLTSGQTPTIATNTYAFLAATMTTTGAADPYVSEWQLQWGEGSISNIISSEFYDQKYYSAISLGGSGNDTILIYDQNGAWTKYTGLEPYFMKKYRTNLLFGSAGAGDVVRMNEKNYFRDYDDAPISAYWTSKDFDLGAPITTKTLLRYYVTGNRVVSGNMTFGYGVERGTLTSATYALDGLTGFFRQVVKPSSLTYSEGIQHRFKVSDATLDGDMSVLSVTGQWRLNTNP